MLYEGADRFNSYGFKLVICVTTLTDITSQLISEGSAKLASVPSGGAGGAAAGGAAAGGAAAEAPKEEEKEEGKKTSRETSRRCPRTRMDADIYYREGRVRRGHGLRSVRLNVWIPFAWTTKMICALRRNSRALLSRTYCDMSLRFAPIGSRECHSLRCRPKVLC